MKDTPEYIRTLQLNIWLSKPAEERLRQMMNDNDALFRFWSNAKESNEIKPPKEYDVILQEKALLVSEKRC
jgi:hypothetical protein